jgi:hypothetical protein
MAKITSISIFGYPNSKMVISANCKYSTATAILIILVLRYFSLLARFGWGLTGTEEDQIAPMYVPELKHRKI